MGVDINKKIITGVLFNESELTAGLVDKYFDVGEKLFGNKVKLFPLNAYTIKTSIFKDYILGICETVEGPVDRSSPNSDDKELLQELDLNIDSAELVKEQLIKFNLTNFLDQVKTYRIHYFS